MKSYSPVSIDNIPCYKRILDTPITVDCFYVPVEGCTHYFLSHFHSDHYTGLKKSFEFPVYCSQTTAELVHARIGCKAVGMEMYENYDMGWFVVRLIEAHHCPGAVMFVFLIGNQFVLHTGDFRYNRKYHMLDIKFKSIYLDNTYESFLDFPSQKEAIIGILSRLDQSNVLCPMNICVLCATYCVGKERVFLSVAEYLNQRVQVSKEKMDIYRCYSKYTVDAINRDVLGIIGERRKTESTLGFKKYVSLNMPVEATKKKSVLERMDALKRIKSCAPMPPVVEYTNDKISMLDRIVNPNTKCMCTPDELPSSPFANIELKSKATRPFDRITTEESQIKVIGMLNPTALSNLVSRIYADKIIVLCGSGWKDKTEFRAYRRMDGRMIKNGIEIVYFRYSEHSSSEELNEFKSAMKYETLVNTVGFGKW